MGTKISAYAELAEAPASTDEFVIVDKSDTSMAATGTTKRVQSQYVTIADASTTVKGKVELATDAEAATSTDTVRALTPSNGQSIVAGATVAAVGKTTPVDADSIPLVDSAASNILKELTWANVKATLLTYFNTLFPGKDGWQSVSDSWTYASADAPTFTITVPSGAASLYGVGDRIKLTQTTVKYFIITAVADTVLTVYGGTDYTLVNAAISAISYSHMKAPLGFPLDTGKWTVRVTDAADRNTGSPTGSTWTNLNAAHTITIPIGAWDVFIQGKAGARKASTNFSDVKVTLSTANNTESDKDMTAHVYEENTNAAASHAIHLAFHRRKTFVLAAKTQYYLNAYTTLASGNLLQIDGASSTTIMEATCSYL